MADQDKVPEPTELVYVPHPSWAPVLAAAGLAGAVAGLFTGWFYSAVGGIVLLVALVRILRESGDEIAHLPRRQRLTSAVSPPLELRRRRSSAWQERL